MKSDSFEIVSYLNLRNKDGSYFLAVPLYVNGKDICVESYAEIMSRIVERMNRHYQQQVSGFFQNKKGGFENEINGENKEQKRQAGSEASGLPASLPAVVSEGATTTS